MSLYYRLELDCETCDRPMHLNVVDISHIEGDPIVINLGDAVSQQTFHCQHCGGITHTSDLEEITLHEPGNENNYEEDQDGDDHG